MKPHHAKDGGRPQKKGQYPLTVPPPLNMYAPTPWSGSATLAKLGGASNPENVAELKVTQSTIPVWVSFVVNPVPIQSECLPSIQKLSLLGVFKFMVSKLLVTIQLEFLV